MVDGTGLRPTTDGSAGSDKIANDYMIATYYKQQASAHPEMTQPAPEPPKPEPPKPSKPTQKSPSTPSHIKHYNPDHGENDSPFFSDEIVEEVFGNIYPMGAYTIKEGKPFTPAQERIDKKTTEFILGNWYDAFSTTADEFISTAIKTLDNVPIGIGDLAKTQMSGMLNFIGFGIDYSSMVNDGISEDKALTAAILHTMVGIGVGALFANSGLAIGAIILLTIITNMFLNNIVDSIIIR